MNAVTSDELLPLYVSEARERLERLHTLAVPGWEQAAVNEARRELHTLKGSSRMMGLKTLSELCHSAEDAVTGDCPESLIQVLRHLDEISAAIDSLEVAGVDAAEDRRAQETAEEVAPGVALESRDGLDIRIGHPTLDSLADDAVRMLLVSRQAASTVESMLSLARIAELGIARDDPGQVLAGLASRLRATAIGTDRAQRRFQEMAESHMETLSALQVQPVQPLLQGLARHVRELAASLGKEVDVVSHPTDCRLDRRISEALKETMLHLVRNAVDHGIEPSEVRRRAGKNDRGLIELRAEADADRIRLEVADDGAGVDADEVLGAAVAKGILSAEDSPRDRDSILQLLFRPGLSTLEHTTEVSGRGVGLDAVEAAVRRVGGTAWLSSENGRGTRVVIKLPSVKRGERIFVVEIGGKTTALVASNVCGFRSAPSPRDAGDFGGVVDLTTTLGRRRSQPQVLIALEGPGLPPGILVDRVCGEEEVLIRPWPACIGSVAPYEGFALLSSGQPVTILDGRLVGGTPREREQATTADAISTTPSPIRVLLVDDSRITREMLRRLLKESDFEVAAVSSGLEALDRLGRGDVDCVVTDIEMPGIDGLELTRRIRADAGLAQLPVIVVSTRDQTADRLAGLDAGADAYLTKQRLDARELTSLVRRLGSAD